MNPHTGWNSLQYIPRALEKIVNSPKKEWLNAKKKMLKLKEGQTTDVSVNLRDEQEVHAAKTRT